MIALNQLDHVQHPVLKRLYQCMQDKQTRICVSADLTRSDEVLHLTDQVGPHICLLKTHVDILEDFSMDFVKRLQDLSAKHNFLIFEDRKFADIGNTVRLQYEKGPYQIASWADLTNAHPLPGEGVITGLKQAQGLAERGLLLVAQLSAKGNLIDAEYVKQACELAEKHRDFVMGFIAQERLIDDPNFITMTPGVQLQAGGDRLGQQYRTPADAIAAGSDIIIVGRGIYQADDPVAAVQAYKAACND